MQNSYEWEHQGEFIEETKLIGIYSTREHAEKVVQRYLSLPGFKKHPADCFHIDKYEIDKNHWEEGFGFED